MAAVEAADEAAAAGGPCLLDALPDALLCACFALLLSADRGAAACACARFARLLRAAACAQRLSWARHGGVGATWVSDFALRGGAAAALAAGGASTLDLSGCRGFTYAALLHACSSNGATLRRVAFAARVHACAEEACAGCAAPSASLHFIPGGAPAGLDAAQLRELAAALPACEALEADACVDVCSTLAGGSVDDEPGCVAASLDALAALRCLRTPSVRVTGASAAALAGAPCALRARDAAALGRLLVAARARTGHTGTPCRLRDLTLQALLLPTDALHALADVLERAPHLTRGTYGAGGDDCCRPGLVGRVSFQRCALDGSAGAAPALARLLRALGGADAAAADDCVPGEAWADAVGAALEAGAAPPLFIPATAPGEPAAPPLPPPFAPARLSLRALRAGGAPAAAAALGHGLAAAACVRHLTLCCADTRREGAAALADALARAAPSLLLLDLTPALGGGRSSLALRLPPTLAAPRAAAAAARARLDLRGLSDGAAAAAVEASGRRAAAAARRDSAAASPGPALTLLLASSAVGARAAAALTSRLTPSPAASVAVLQVLRSRLCGAEFLRLFRAAGRLTQLTLVTERRVPCAVLAAAAAALTHDVVADENDVAGAQGTCAWAHMRAFRLHCLAYDDGDDDGDDACTAADAAGAWARVLASPVAEPLALLQLSADVPCGALLALRHAPRGGRVDADALAPSSSAATAARTVLRLLRGERDFTVDPLSGDIY
jgi:hypothetical protein